MNAVKILYWSDYARYDFAFTIECGFFGEQFCIRHRHLGIFGELPTGGDTIDFTTVADKLPSTQIIQAFAESQNGNSGYYVAVAGTALNNWKLKAFNGGGTELTAGAYPASVTSDVVQLAITARKLL